MQQSTLSWPFSLISVSVYLCLDICVARLDETRLTFSPKILDFRTKKSSPSLLVAIAISNNKKELYLRCLKNTCVFLSSFFFKPEQQPTHHPAPPLFASPPPLTPSYFER
ncbi:hypothetical protein FRC14_007807 [Serendipita sp. 396]|nr:hypothetical protein FRC14_007807 [Serendipita sp. 396]KAG8793397.1 hypothetical protein FRC16_010966 [Serendipita sp. 398]KAG8831302.1 hypothetical protein FRC18_006790 [Serendipita sp. 400]KAG8863228.1 hypothetical protein FRC20_010854 [Serendipita sp. 405]